MTSLYTTQTPVRARSGPLAAWTCAWQAGGVSLAHALGAVSGTDAAHLVLGLPEHGGEQTPLREALLAWQQDGRPVRLVLPVPGDVRGLPGPDAFRSAALEAGEAVCGTSLGLVPTVHEHAASSAPTEVVWHAHRSETPPPDPVQVDEARYELSTAIRESASALAAAGVAGGDERVATRLHDARRAGERLNLPPGFPSGAVALLAQAERMRAVLELALDDPVGGAVDRAGIAARTEGLRPLVLAVRRARLAGYNALAVSG